MSDNEQRQIRLKKLGELRELGVELYPYRYDVSHAIHDVIDQADEHLKSEAELSLAGRLMQQRIMGKASFAHLQDRSGRLQLFFQRDHIGQDAYAQFKKMDLGDIVGVKGVVFHTKTGELSLRVNSFVLLCKSLRPLPSPKTKDGEVFSPFQDSEARYRQRHIDLLVNPESMALFQKRTQLIRCVRQYLDERGFLEVETPVLQPQYGGANARPFVTHHNTLGQDFYLRISNELYLKRLIVGGMERVYELCHDFRNEGMDHNHNPEFTMIEFYWAYADYFQAMGLVEDLLRSVAQQVVGSLQVTYRDQAIDFEPAFARGTMRDLILEHAGVDILESSDQDLRAACERLDIEVDPKANYGQLVDELFSEKVEPKLVQPTFVLDHPKAISPLAKQHRDHPDKLVERFELIVAGHELANSFSELNDPIDQRARMEAQSAWLDAGDAEAQPLDEDYIETLEYGMPPTAGVGIGIDRLVMILTGRPTIKDVLLFPHMRQLTSQSAEASPNGDG